MLKKSLLPLLALLAATVGCSATDRGSMAITKMCALPKPSDGACTYSCDEAWASGSAELDLLTTDHLEFPLEFTNSRVDNSDSSLRTNTNGATIETFEMEYHAVGLNIARANWDQSFKVPTASTAVGLVTLVPSAVGQALAAAMPVGPTAMDVEVRAHGHYWDGTSFDTAWFQVPVVVKKKGEAYACADTTKQLHLCPDNNGQSAWATCD